MEQLFKLHGMPENVISDREPIFINRLWQDLFTTQVQQLITLGAQYDGQTEVVNRT